MSIKQWWDIYKKEPNINVNINISIMIMQETIQKAKATLENM